LWLNGLYNVKNCFWDDGAMHIQICSTSSNILLSSIKFVRVLYNTCTCKIQKMFPLKVLFGNLVVLMFQVKLSGHIEQQYDDTE
jgi:hypothetical protein